MTVVKITIGGSISNIPFQVVNRALTFGTFTPVGRLLMSFFFVVRTESVTVVISVAANATERHWHVFLYVPADRTVAAFRKREAVLLSTKTTIGAYVSEKSVLKNECKEGNVKDARVSLLGSGGLSI